MRHALRLMLLLCVIDREARAEGEFVTSYWYGPPPKFTTVEHYRRIKEANFNVVFPPRALDPTLTVEQNLKVLDLCRMLEMRAVVHDPRMPRSLVAPGA